MRFLPALALAFATGLSVRADVVVEQQATGPMLNGKVTMKIKGDRVRKEFPGAIMLIDLKTGEMKVLMEAQKVVVRKDANALKQQMDAAARQAGFDVSTVEKPKATGVTEKVGGWTAEIYEFKLAGLVSRIWVVKDFPNEKIVRDEWRKMNTAGTGGFDASRLDVPGMIVKFEMNTGMGVMTSTIVKAEEVTLPDSEFVVPPGYSDQVRPGEPGLGPK